MSKKIIIQPLDNAEFVTNTYLFIDPSIELMGYINTCEMIFDKIKEMNYSQIYRVEFRLPPDATFYHIEGGLEEMDGLEEGDAVIMEVDEEKFGGDSWMCDCGDILTVRDFGDWLHFRAYNSEYSSEEVWVDIEKHILFKLIEEALNETQG